MSQAPNEPELRAIISSLHSSLNSLNGEILFVLGECKKGEFPEATMVKVTDVFEPFFGTVQHDVRAEVLNLEDKLGLRPGLQPYDPGIVNPDPRVTMRFIQDWLWADFLKLDELVEELKAGTSDLSVGLAYTLVAETGANMLNIYSEILDALERLERILKEEGR